MSATLSARTHGEYRAVYTRLEETPEFHAMTMAGQRAWYAVKIRLGYAGIGVLYAEELVPRFGRDATLEIVRAALDELEAGGWIRRHGATVWLVNGLRFEPSMSPADPKHRKGVARRVASLPSSPLVDAFRAAYAPFFVDPSPPPPGRATDGPSEGPSDGPSEGHRRGVVSVSASASALDRQRESEQDQAARAREAAAPYTALVAWRDTPQTPTLDDHAAQLAAVAARVTALVGAERAPTVARGFFAEMQAALTGMHGVSLTAPQLESALRDWLCAEPAPPANLRAFRAFLAGVAGLGVDRPPQYAAAAAAGSRFPRRADATPPPPPGTARPGAAPGARTLTVS